MAEAGRVKAAFRRIGRWRLRSWSGAAAILVAGTVIMLAWSVASAWTRPPLSPDSWAYLLLARSFHATPYHIPLIRQYQFNTGFSDNFPPVWPLLLLGGSWLLGSGPRLGIIVATVASIALLPLLYALLGPFIRPIGRRRAGAAAAWAGMLSFGPFLDEIVSGRSIPAALLLYCALAVAVTRMKRLHVGAGFAAGTAAGLLWMTRFDAAPVVLIVGAGVPIVWGAGSRLRWWAGYGIAVGLIVAPWVVYSHYAFGVPFAIDNTIVARRVDPSAVTDWFSTPPRTVGSAPVAWLGRVLGNVPGLLGSLRRAGWRYADAMCLLLAFTLWTAVQPGNAPPRVGRRGRLALLITFALACQLAGPLTIGAFDLRYFVQCFAAVILWSVVLLLTARTIRFRVMMLVPLAIGLALGWKKSLGSERAQRSSFAAIAAPGDVEHWPDAAGARLRLLGSCLPKDARVLMVEDGVSAYLVAYYLHRTALELPDNWRTLSDPDRSRFLTQFGVSHVVLGPGALSIPAGRGRQVSGCGPLRVVVPDPALEVSPP